MMRRLKNWCEKNLTVNHHLTNLLYEYKTLKTMNISKAKAHFSTVVDHVIAGNIICISKPNVPVARRV